MAIDKLGLYNNALLLLGQRRLSSLTEDRETRHRLDDIFDAGALNTCVELAKPTFAREVNMLNTPTAATQHGLSNVHALPADYLAMVDVFSDSTLDQPVNRYVIENRTVACEYATIYVRFISSALAETYASWTQAFTNVAASYFARELAARISPDRYADMDTKFTERLQLAITDASTKEPNDRPAASSYTLTADLLAVYNDALILMGLDEITTIDDDSDRRAKIDRVMNNGAVDYCLNVVKPVFARTTVQLSTPTTSAEHDLDSVHTLPTDYITTLGAYSDSKLDQPLTRFIVDADTLACEVATVYFRYVKNSALSGSWSSSFKRVLAAYLARETWLSLNPGSYENYSNLDNGLQERIESAVTLENEKEPLRRSTGTLTTLTPSWLRIYNDALLIMGLDEIISVNDDSDRRVKLDRALDADLVESILEETGWTFGLTSVESTYDSAIEPEFGHTRGHRHPDDMQVLYGVYADAYMRSPLKDYKDESEIIFCNYDVIYLQYVDDAFLRNPGNWPAYFRRLVGARLAKDAAASLPGADAARADEEFRVRQSDAKSTDAMKAPPHRLAQGSWTSARLRGIDRNRPGNY